MTAATTVLLAHLRQHIGTSSERRKSLYQHCCEKSGRTLSRSTLHRIILGVSEPGADLLIPIMRWLQLQGVIRPGAKAVGLFIYTKPLNPEKNGKKAGKTTARRQLMPV